MPVRVKLIIDSALDFRRKGNFTYIRIKWEENPHAKHGARTPDLHLQLGRSYEHVGPLFGTK